jgi:ATP-binding cassette subfamily F protein 3
MLLLSCSELARGFDDGPLFRGIGFELFAGERIGLVGPNGVGKTTLLRILAGLDQPDEGAVRLHAGARAALLRQQPTFEPGRTLIDEARSALDELILAQEDLVRTAERLAQTTDPNEHDALAARYERLNDLLHHHDAYNVDHRVEHVLGGLGFVESDYGRAVDTFSGGQQSRLMLAKLLLAAPDVMLLDEPSNHLDIDATRWLEEYLVKQHEAMLIVSHDRYFLDRVVEKVFELNGKQINSYVGNYQAYVRQREERYQHQLKQWQAQQEYVAKQEEYIRRVHYGQLHKQAQSRRKALDRLELVERPTLIETPHMHFGDVRRTGDVVLQVEDLAKAYDQPLFRDLSFTLERGRRLGIMGPNGSGKTTLLRVLMGEEASDKGAVQRGHLVSIGYYDQHLQTLDAELPVIRAVWPQPDPDVNEQGMRDLLARFGLTGDQVYQQVGKLSGGERSRAALARLVAREVNVLVMDEPTNHLDLWACEALEAGLREFDGTVIVVSHDRYFLNRVVDLLIVLDGKGDASLIYGNYDTFLRMKGDEKAKKDKAPRRNETPPAVEASKSKERRRRRFPYRKIEDLEAEIAAVEALVKELENRLASPDLYRDGDKVKETTRAFEETKARLRALYEHWEEALELN